MTSMVIERNGHAPAGPVPGVNEHWAGQLITRDGFCFQVRPAQPDDEPALAEFFLHVTPDDLRFRFLSALREVGHDRLAAMTNVDHDRTEDFLAFTNDGRLIATALLAADAAHERAEVAISIDQAYKHLGISWTLLDHLVNYARARGFKLIESIEARENQAALALEREMGFVAVPLDEDPALVRVQYRLD